MNDDIDQRILRRIEALSTDEGEPVYIIPAAVDELRNFCAVTGCDYPSITINDAGEICVEWLDGAHVALQFDGTKLVKGLVVL